MCQRNLQQSRQALNWPSRELEYGERKKSQLRSSCCAICCAGAEVSGRKLGR